MSYDTCKKCINSTDTIPDCAPPPLPDDRGLINPDGRSLGTCSLPSFTSLHSDYSTEQSPIQKRQLRTAKSLLELERQQHAKEIAEFSAKLEEYSSLLRLNRELTEKNSKTLLHAEEMTPERSPRETRLASLQEQLNIKETAIQQLSDKLAEHQVLERQHQEKESQLVEKLREKEQVNKRLLQRIANQEAINKRLIYLLGLQVYCLKNEANSTSL